eukprot:m.310126 g.310126  ORF g.310126 m.310126 type:complete len:784 (+) comp49762_c0_seq1:104-2455(+)
MVDLSALAPWFRAKAAQSGNSSTSLPLPPEISWTPPFPFESKRLRVVILREHKARGKQLVFDSHVWERQLKRKTSPGARQSGVMGKINHAETRRNSLGKSKAGDTEMLAEMMFGSVPFVSKSRGATVKVHKLRDHSRLLFTKVFTVQLCMNSGSSINDPTFSSARSLPISTSANKDVFPDRSLPTSPLDIRMPESSFTSNASNGSFQASSPTGSLQRRRVKSFLTSFEFYNRQDEAIVSPEMRKCSKLAIGVISEMPVGDSEEAKRKRRYLEDFFFSYFPLVESHIEWLKCQIERLLQTPGKNIQESIAEFVTIFKSNIVSLSDTMRLRSPFWSCFVTSKAITPRPVACKQFIGLLRNALQHFNKQSNNYFMTRLLSATLQYHLGWVSTVSPAERNPTQAFLNKHFSHSLTSLAQSHPYNPLWAQLADLYGSVGSPCHFARTILVGRKGSVIYQLLYILSYFIRCADVTETDYELDSLLSTLDTDSIQTSISTDDSKSEESKSLSASVAVPEPSSDIDNTESVDSGLGTEDGDHSKEKRGLSGFASSILQHDMAQMFNLDQHLEDKFREMESIPLPCLQQQKHQRDLTLEETEMGVKSLSMSLYGGYVPEYLPDFVLHGTAEPLDDFIVRLQQDLRAQILHPCVEEVIDEAVCIVADTDRWTCDVISLANKRNDSRRQYTEPMLQIRRAPYSSLVHQILQMQTDFHSRDMSEEFCLTQLEDSLQEIYYKSKILSEHHRTSGGTPVQDGTKQAAMAGAEKDDLPLLFSVASTHCPYIPPQLDPF